MPRLIFHEQNIPDLSAFLSLCPFGALEVSSQGNIIANAACKMCKICLKQGPKDAVTWVEDELRSQIDKRAFGGILVYVDHVQGRIHPVTFELLGKARALAEVSSEPVYALMLGQDIGEQARELLHYPVDQVWLGQHEALRDFRIDAYTALFQQVVEASRPGTLLIGATPVGRQLAPRVAARLRTGLTADCTVLQMRAGGDLVQIRPAFGGNIMAEIITPHHRPQMATVRYKVMDAPERLATPSGKIVPVQIDPAQLHSRIHVLGILPKPQEETIESAQTLVVAGRGIKKEGDIALLARLAERLGGQLACTRPLVENGWMEARRQIGLSGRTVRPRLILTCGVSGAIQFVAGMNNAETIIAINRDPRATIFKSAHVGLVGDLYHILPPLLAKLENGGTLS